MVECVICGKPAHPWIRHGQRVCGEHLYLIYISGWKNCPLCGSKADFEPRGFNKNYLKCKNCSAEWEVETKLRGEPEKISLHKPCADGKGSGLKGVKQPFDWWVKTDLVRRIERREEAKVTPVRARVPKKPVPPPKAGEPSSPVGGIIALIILVLIIAVPVWYFFLRAPSTSPATFTVSNITISPAEVRPSDIVNISATVTNTGDLEGTYTVTLKIDGLVEGSQDVTLAGGASETVSFTVTKTTEQTYNVDMGGLAGSFIVESPYPITKTIYDSTGDDAGISFLGVPAGWLPWFDITRVRITINEDNFDVKITFFEDIVDPIAYDVTYIYAFWVATQSYTDPTNTEYVLSLEIDRWSKTPAYLVNGSITTPSFNGLYDSSTKTIQFKGPRSAIGDLETFYFQASTYYTCDKGHTFLDRAPDGSNWASFP